MKRKVNKNKSKTKQGKVDFSRRINFKCCQCEHVVGTSNGVRSHISRHHPGASLSDYVTTNEPVTSPKRNGRTGKRYLITTATSFIDVPCVLRVNIGRIETRGVCIRPE